MQLVDAAVPLDWPEKGMEGEACIYFFNTIYAARFCQSQLCLANDNVEQQCSGSSVL